MQIHKKTFPQSCRYGKYLSFATLLTPITVLGAEKFAIPCKVFFAELQVKKFWAWAETKTGLCWGRKTAKASDDFQTNWIFKREKEKKKNQFCCVGHTLKGMFLFCVFYIKDPISLKISSDAFAVILLQQRPVSVSAHAQNFFSWSSCREMQIVQPPEKL